MNNVIVPIDFSETSKNAARYAAHISTLIPDAHLILYNVFDTLEYGSDSSPLGTEGEEDASRKAIVELALASVQSELAAITGARVQSINGWIWPTSGSRGQSAGDADHMPQHPGPRAREPTFRCALTPATRIIGGP